MESAQAFEAGSVIARARRYGWLWLCVVLAGLKLWLVRAQTIYAIAPAPADDELFLSQAEMILKGEWLGPLSDLTLTKGPGYSLWLALNHLIGVPLLVSQALLYAIACAVLAFAARPALTQRWARAVLYLAVLYSPSTWANGPATRVTRDGFYSSMTLLLLASAMGLVLRLRAGPRTSTKWAVSTGLVGATVAMTREEGLWLVPSLLILVGLGLIRAWRCGWRAWAAPAAVAAGAYLVPLGAVSAVNRIRYGVFTTCEMTTDYFEAAYGALTRVKAGTWNPYVPVPKEARRRIYEVSPALREIGPYLEGNADGWAIHGCKAMGVCDDIAGGWFGWAFRNAVSAAGKYRESGETARAWYRQLAREIDDACRSGTLECLPPRSSLMSPWREAYVSPLLSSFGRAAGFFATYDSVSPRPSRPAGSEFDLRRYEAMTHERIPRPRVRLTGLLASRVGPLRAVVADSAGRDAEAAIDAAVLPSEGSASASGLTLRRYQVDTSCSLGCQLMFLTAPGAAMAVPVSADAGELVFQLGGWRTEAFLSESPQAGGTVPVRITILGLLTRVYALGIPVLVFVALLLLTRRLWTRAGVDPDVCVPALALAVAVLVRLLLLSLISVSSFPGIDVQYCAPAYPLCVAAITLVLISEAAAIARRREQQGWTEESSPT